MNWTTLIQALLDSGMTQAQIADACDTGQSYISGLYRGERKQPNWALGNRLIALHRERCGTDPKATRKNRRTTKEPPHVMRERRKGAGNA